MKKGSKTIQKEIKNDSTYFKEYSKLYALLMEREQLLKKLRKGEGTAEDEKALTVSAKNITNYRRKFWKRVETGKKGGRKYLFERISEKCGFTDTEKKIVLFFISHTSCTNNDEIKGLTQVIDLFDFSGSVLQRASFVNVIEGEQSLTKRDILVEGKGALWNPEGYFLNKGFYNSVVKVLNGEAVDILKDYEKEGGQHKVKEKKKSSSVGEIREAAYTFDDIIVPEETVSEVKMVLNMAHGENRDKLGVFSKIRTGKGTGFLFYGAPGTGKSMMAEAVASFVGKKVLKVEYPKILSSLMGETDKQIAAIFKLAKEEDLVVILDEADSLLYDRKYAQWEHDIRFVNEMLQEIENYEGIVVLTTNMDDVLDPALERRLAYKVKFILPDESCRVKIWERHMPSDERLSGQIDYGSLSRKYEFSGGNIKNAVLNAARKAVAEKKEHLTMEDFIEGAEMEKKGMFAKKRKRSIEGFGYKVNV